MSESNNSYITKSSEPYSSEYISQNAMDYINANLDKMSIVRNKSYQVHVEKAEDYIKNGQETVYNHLEDSEAKVKEGQYVITGCAGEKWPTGKVEKYGLTADQIPEGGVDVMTKETDELCVAMPMPSDMQFTAKTSWADLTGNKPINSKGDNVPHGGGDMLLVAAKVKDGKIVPDFENQDSFRVVNGEIADKLYQQAEPDRIQKTIDAAAPTKSNLMSVTDAIKSGKMAEAILHDQGALDNVMYNDIAQKAFMRDGEALKAAQAEQSAEKTDESMSL